MARGSAPLVAQRRRRMPATVRPQTHPSHINKAATLRRSARIAKKSAAEERPSSPANSEQNLANPQQSQKRAVKVNSSQQRRRSLRLQTANPIQKQPKSARRVKAPRRREEDGAPSSHASPKRARKSATTISEARIEHWTKNGTWPTEEQEKTMSRYLALPGKDTEMSHSSSNQQPRDLKSVPYAHAMFADQLAECGSFLKNYREGISAKSKELCQRLREKPQPIPEHTLFSDDNLFEKTCERLLGENETKVIRDIGQLIVPSAEVLADKGAKDLEILRETTNACWVTAIPFVRPSGSPPAPRPQPDFGLGFKKDAFSQEQLQKLKPFIGDPLRESSVFTATHNMYFPFLTGEVKCGGNSLDVADKQNAHSQSVMLHGLTELFRLVGRKNELHQEINGFSISHSDSDVRIYGHYAIISGEGVGFYRHTITKFGISPSEADSRWRAYTFIRNIYDLWLPNHFRRICSAIDMLPAKEDFEVSDLTRPALPILRSGRASHRSGPASSRSGPASSRSGLASSRSELPPLFEDSYCLSDAEDTRTQSESSNSKKKKKKKRKKKT